MDMLEKHGKIACPWINSISMQKSSKSYKGIGKSSKYGKNNKHKKSFIRMVICELKRSISM